MPITETTHRCGVCRKKFNFIESAQKCEDQGTPNLNNFPKGLIYEVLRSGADTCDTGGMLIAITKSAVVGGHTVELQCWSAADVCVRSTDAVGHLTPMDTFKETVPIVFQNGATIPVSAGVRPGTLRLSRLIDHLVRNMIKPLLWDGEKVTMLHPCPYEEKFSEYE